VQPTGDVVSEVRHSPEAIERATLIYLARLLSKKRGVYGKEVSDQCDGITSYVPKIEPSGIWLPYKVV
jgi:hypothetical protein